MSSTGAEPTWVVDVDEVETRFAESAELRVHLAALEALNQGAFFLYRRWSTPRRWLTFLAPRVHTVPCVSVEWFGGFACLFFLDDSWSEYRVLDSDRPVHPGEEIRREISHGELAPAPLDECMTVDRAFDAIREYVATEQRPSWLKYRYFR